MTHNTLVFYIHVFDIVDILTLNNYYLHLLLISSITDGSLVTTSNIKMDKRVITTFFMFVTTKSEQDVCA